MKEKKKLTYESAKTELASVKEELSVAQSELKDFLKKNKLKRDEDHSGHADKKIAKQFKTLSDAVTSKQTRKDTLIKFMKENKPAPEPRESKYNYPSEVKSSLDKKKYRATMRANARKAKVDLDVYLANPEKYAKIIAEAARAKPDKKGGKKKKKKKSAESGEEAPVKKLKVVPDGAPKKKKKKVVAPEPPAAEAEGEDEGED